MLEILTAPIQFAFRWMDEHPGVRMVFAIALFGIAIVASIPGPVLDLWIVLALGSSAAMALLLVLVGSELDAREALAGLPAYLRRFAFHRLALSLALTKAILLGKPTGQIMGWLADHGLGNSVGLALSAFAAIVCGRLIASHFPHFERLSHAASRLPVEYARMEQAIAAGRLSPAAASRHRQALADELQVLGDARQVCRLLRTDALGSLGVALVLLTAGLITGLVFKEWPLPLVLSTLTLYGLVEGILTGAPGLFFAVTLSQWLGAALDATPEPPVGPREEPSDHVGVPLLGVEVGRELAPALRRSFPERVSQVRAGVARDLGYPLPDVELITVANLPAKVYRVTIRGVVWSTGTLDPNGAGEAIAHELDQAARSQAAALHSLDATQHLLDELAVDHPVAVAQAVERLGLPVLHGVFLGLLREQVSLRDLAGLVDALVGLAGTSASVPVLVEHARKALAPQICQRLANAGGVIVALDLDPAWNDDLVELPASFAGAPGERAVAQDFASAVREAVERVVPINMRPALVVARHHRPVVAEALAQALGRVAVLAPDELSARFEVRWVGRVEKPARLAVSTAVPEESRQERKR